MTLVNQHYITVFTMGNIEMLHSLIFEVTHYYTSQRQTFDLCLSRIIYINTWIRKRVSVPADFMQHITCSMTQHLLEHHCYPTKHALLDPSDFRFLLIYSHLRRQTERNPALFTVHYYLLYWLKPKTDSQQVGVKFLHCASRLFSSFISCILIMYTGLREAGSVECFVM